MLDVAEFGTDPKIWAHSWALSSQLQLSKTKRD